MPGWLSAALSFLQAVLGFFQNRQLEQAGADAQQVKVQEGVNAEVEKAAEVPLQAGADPVFDKQLHSAYDRSDTGK